MFTLRDVVRTRKNDQAWVEQKNGCPWSGTPSAYRRYEEELEAAAATGAAVYGVAAIRELLFSRPVNPTCHEDP